MQQYSEKKGTTSHKYSQPAKHRQSNGDTDFQEGKGQLLISGVRFSNQQEMDD